MAWVAFDGKAYVAGTLGAGATFTLPSGEIGLDAHDSLVLSTDAAKSTLILRDLVSGAVVAERKTGLTIDNGQSGLRERADGRWVRRRRRLERRDPRSLSR